MFARQLGAVERVHLSVPDMEDMPRVEIPSGQFLELDLKDGDQVFVIPHQLRRFPPAP